MLELGFMDRVRGMGMGTGRRLMLRLGASGRPQTIITEHVLRGGLEISRRV